MRNCGKCIALTACWCSPIPVFINVRQLFLLFAFNHDQLHGALLACPGTSPELPAVRGKWKQSCLHKGEDVLHKYTCSFILFRLCCSEKSDSLTCVPMAAFYATSNTMSAEPEVSHEALTIARKRLQIHIASENWTSQTGMEFEDIFTAIDHKFKGVVGLNHIKENVKAIIAHHTLNIIRKAVGMHPEEEPLNLIFVGGPGTCKTTVARLLAGCLHSAGIIQRDHTGEVQRDDLVASHIGQSEEKTNKAVQRANGGVLFIDEAYTLYKHNSVNDFGMDVINTLMKYMNNDLPSCPSPVIIMSGYRNEMTKFLESNEGLKRRFRSPWIFPNYTPLELAQIFKQICTTQGFQLESQTNLTDIFSAIPAQIRISLNGSLCARLLSHIKDIIDRRVMQKKQISHIALIQLSSITNEDIVAALQQVCSYSTITQTQKECDHLCASTQTECEMSDTQTQTNLSANTQTECEMFDTQTQTVCEYLSANTQTECEMFDTQTQTDLSSNTQTECEMSDTQTQTVCEYLSSNTQTECEMIDTKTQTVCICLQTLRQNVRCVTHRHRLCVSICLQTLRQNVRCLTHRHRLCVSICLQAHRQNVRCLTHRHRQICLQTHRQNVRCLTYKHRQCVSICLQTHRQNVRCLTHRQIC
ncbi:uncharacterized protein [Ptychodera flava]|uniref:uncharacterized protein n=1 Tax=Ptychodera flava TaxID=63121 RepID=UPI00396A0ED0